MRRDIDISLTSLEQSILAVVEQGYPAFALSQLVDDARSLPRWRFIRRFHLERQAKLLNLCRQCFDIGRTRGARSK